MTSIYYGIHIPADVPLNDKDDKLELVHTDKSEVLIILKRIKKARFKQFDNFADAQHFSTHGVDLLNKATQNGHIDEVVSPPVETVEPRPNLRSLKCQDLVQLRKTIESGDCKEVCRTIWDNPRYLVSSGDTAAVMHEGARYNALHYATRNKNATMCRIILGAISNPKFIGKLYNDELSTDAIEARIAMLLDLYLNTPDKGLNETPLHFASKFGALDCVEVLTSFPQCDKTIRNKLGQTPKDIICSKCDPNPDVHRKILVYLEDEYYVPVFRAENNVMQPTIGEPFTPTKKPTINMDPMSPRLEIHAFAGPMSKQEATVFRKKWKTPPRQTTDVRFGSPQTPNRNLNNLNLTPMKATTATTPTSKKSFSSHAQRLLDPEKGLECVGRELAHEENIVWQEYWPFLDTFIDLSSANGLRMFENYLRDRVLENISQTFPDSFDSKIRKSGLCCKTTAPKSATNGISDFWRYRDKNRSSSLTDFTNPFDWSNLNQSNDKCKFPLLSSPMTQLCDKFGACAINEPSNEVNDLHPDVHLEKSLEIYSNRMVAMLTTLLHKRTNNAKNCVKSLFDINLQLNNQMNKSDSEKENVGFSNNKFGENDEIRMAIAQFLMVDVRHLNNIVLEFQSDSRFNDCNFKAIHAKIARNICKKMTETILVGDKADNDNVADDNKLNANVQKLNTLIDTVQILLENVQKTLPNKTLKIFEKHFNCILDDLALFLNLVVISLTNVTNSTNEFMENLYMNTDWEKLAMDCSCQFTSDKKKDGKMSSRVNSLKKKRRRTQSLNLQMNSLMIKPNVKLDEQKLNESHASSPLYQPVENHNYRNSAHLLTWDSGESSDDEFDSSDEVFLTPPTSPKAARAQKTRRHMCSNEFVIRQFMNLSSDCAESGLSSSSSDDESMFVDAHTHDVLDVFIYGNSPTKTDNAAFLAIKDVDMTPEEFPHLYKWRHHMRTFSDEERSKWPPFKGEANVPEESYGIPLAESTPRTANQSESLFPPKKPWLRITGLNAPQLNLSRRFLVFDK